MAMRGIPDRLPAAIQQIARFDYDYSEAYRDGDCFLSPSQSSSAFAERCVDAPRAAAPLLVLWGDSHAAHFYPGLHHVKQRLNFRTAQFTASACAPIIGVRNPTRPHCQEINDFVLEKIALLRPDTVMLAAYWTVHDVTHLDRTIAHLRERGVSRIVLMGEVPMWKGSLPRALLEYFRSHLRQELPARMAFGLLRSPAASDAHMTAKSVPLGITFVSAANIRCNEDGCLTRVGDKPTDLVAWDYAHLTEAGSTFVIDAAMPRLFDRMPARVCSQGCS